MKQEELKVVNRLGLHARAAAKLVNLTNQFRSQVTLIKEGEEVEGKSILGILLLAAPQGSQLELRCEGDDETEACIAITDLFARGFDEDTGEDQGGQTKTGERGR